MLIVSDLPTGPLLSVHAEKKRVRPGAARSPDQWYPLSGYVSLPNVMFAGSRRGAESGPAQGLADRGRGSDRSLAGEAAAHVGRRPARDQGTVGEQRDRAPVRRRAAAEGADR